MLCSDQPITMGLEIPDGNIILGPIDGVLKMDQYRARKHGQIQSLVRNPTPTETLEENCGVRSQKTRNPER